MYTCRRNRQYLTPVVSELSWTANWYLQTLAGRVPLRCATRAGPLLCVVLFGEASCLFLCLMGRPEVGMVTIHRQRLCHSALHVIWETQVLWPARGNCVVCSTFAHNCEDFSLANLLCYKRQLCDQYTTDKWNTLQSIWPCHHSSNLYP